MTVDLNIAELIGILEYKIGSQTYNPNSYNGWTGDVGCGFKYPLSYYKTKADLSAHMITKARSQIEHIDPECVSTMKYAFGSNQLHIGDGLVKVLEYLEERYNIDFNKLEKEHIERKKKELTSIEDRLNAGETIDVGPGIKKVGIDIPAGNYMIMKSKDKDSFFMSIDIYNADGEIAKHVFTSDDEDYAILEDGYYTKSLEAFLLKKDM